jgi:hypothetical protein
MCDRTGYTGHIRNNSETLLRLFFGKFQKVKLIEYALEGMPKEVIF